MRLSSNLPNSEAYYRAALQWADLDSAASLLEESKSAYLSQMMLKYPDLPVSRAEMQVKGSHEWMDYINKMVAARKKANLAKVELEYFRMKFFEWNSHQATERVQARL